MLSVNVDIQEVQTNENSLVYPFTYEVRDTSASTDVDAIPPSIPVTYRSTDPEVLEIFIQCFIQGVADVLN